MSNTVEQKALEEYPKSYVDENISSREGYIKGYAQAFQDIEEFIYDNFNIHPHDCHVVQYVSDNPLEDIDDFVKQIKNYMQNEM